MLFVLLFALLFIKNPYRFAVSVCWAGDSLSPVGYVFVVVGAYLLFWGLLCSFERAY